jgi:hypothetical protein
VVLSKYQNGKIKENDSTRKGSRHGKVRNTKTVSVENIKGRENLENPYIARKIILKCKVQ